MAKNTVMKYFDKTIGFVKQYKVGAVIGGILPMPFAFLAFINQTTLFKNVFFIGAYVGGTLSLVLNVMFGVLLGAGVEWFIKKKLMK